MLVFNKYLKELGYKKSDFTDKSDRRYKLDKERGVVEAQTWNLDRTIVFELYTYLRDFQENYMKMGTPLPYSDNEKEWHKLVGVIVDGLKAYLKAEEQDDPNIRDMLYDQFDDAWKLLGDNIQHFWW